MALPRRLEKPLVANVTVELRFEPKIHEDALFGVIYSSIQEKFPNVEKLPILDLPGEIRTKDTSLTYQPHYRISNEDYNCQIGPRVVSLSPHLYPGWTTMSAYILEVFDSILNSNCVKSFSRLGMRYINGLSADDVYSVLNFKLELMGNSYNNSSLYLRTEIENPPYKSTVQILNQAKYTTKHTDHAGPVLDIDTSISNKILPNKESITEHMTQAHELTKTIFFGLLEESYLKSLGPNYE